MDADNAYDPSLWDELRRVGPSRVGVLAVTIDSKGYTERPQFDANGVFRGWSAGWCYGPSL